MADGEGRTCYRCGITEKDVDFGPCPVCFEWMCGFCLFDHCKTRHFMDYDFFSRDRVTS